MNVEMNVLQGVDEVGHTHADVAGGSLRAATFGAMDGLVTNISLVAGMGAAGGSSRLILLTGAAGLVAGAFSMAIGEFTSVSTQNEQIDHELHVELDELENNPTGELAELAELFGDMGIAHGTAVLAARDVHQDVRRAARVHVIQELGLDPEDKPSPWVAAISSFIMFALGALVPLIPYLLGFSSLALGLATGGAGLLIAGAVSSRFTITSWWVGALRQLVFGAAAAGATYVVGALIGVGVN
jgi:VIT1/CCC1 family predicted Fe2+/Mn2+ transporter